MKFAPRLKRLFYFVVSACLATGLVIFFTPSREIGMQWMLGVLVILLLLFGGKDLYLHWLIHRAERASIRGDRTQVKNYYYKIYKLDPNGFIGKFASGVIHSVNGYWVHAVSSFREALSLRPHNFHVIFNLAVCLMRLERYQEALNYLSFLASKRPRWRFLFGAMGEAYYHLGDYTEACACLQRELFYNPGNDTARQLFALAWEARENAA